MKDLKTLHKWLVLKISEHKLEIHNDSTYSFSQGYRRCLKDIREFVEQVISENK